MTLYGGNHEAFLVERRRPRIIILDLGLGRGCSIFGSRLTIIRLGNPDYTRAIRNERPMIALMDCDRMVFTGQK